MDFEKAYKNLNLAQKQAVDKIDGPVLVIAGPGTGKTQLLSTRVANIIKKTDTDPRNILCLTFTNKAATNMRDRLQKLTGGEARNVSVKTFHSFAAEIMGSYSEYFWDGANLTNAPEAVQLDILESIISKLPLDNPYAPVFEGRYTMLGKAQKQISRAKEAGLTPDKLRVMLNANLAYIDEVENRFIDILSSAVSHKTLNQLAIAVNKLPNQPIDKLTAPLIGLETKIKESLAFAIKLDEPTTKATNTSKWKSGWLTAEDKVKGMHRERKNNKNWLALADIYEQYRISLHQQGFYDYSDMLLEVILQIEQHSDLRAEIQESYNFVLIDEFQDSNSAQLRLAHLVADHFSANGKPNIMAVGDDDQSIYGFNGAELNNMLHFERTYGKEAVTTIVLQENYRSTKQVLATAKNIIENSQDRLVNRIPGLVKNLQAKAKDLPKGKIIHLRYLTKEHQQHEVAQSIADYHKQNPKQTIAVLARNHKSLEPIASQLYLQKTTFNYERQQDILHHEAIKQIIAIARVVKAIIDGDKDEVNAVLCQLLRHPMFNISNKILWDIACSNRYDTNWLASLINIAETKELGEWFNWLANQATHQPLAVTLENIIGIRDDSPKKYFKAYYVQAKKITNTYLETLSAIRLLRNLVNEFTVETSPTLNDFLNFIDTEKTNKKVISDASPLVNNDDSIILLSVHKAKGLEFDVVFIVDVIEKDWQPSSKREGVPSNLPLQPPLESDDEYTRLMYVAVTRAKHTIIFTSYSKNGVGEDVLASSLIRSVEVKKISAPNQQKTVDILEKSLTWPRLIQANERLALKPILDHFTINATNLIKFLDVSDGGPTKFLEGSLLRLPQSKTPFMSYGTAIHAALEFAQKQTNLVLFDLNKTIQEYKKALLKENLSKEELVQQAEKGEKALKHLFTDLGYKLQKSNRPEISLNKLMVSHAQIGGKLDRIDVLDNSAIRIVDYKTGKGLNNFETKDKTKEVKAWKHKLQLTFYALLAQNHPDFNKYKNIEGQMVYVETSYQKGLLLSYTPSQTEIDRLANIVNAVWQKVQTLDLPDINGYSQDLVGITQFEQDLLKDYKRS